MPRHVVLKYGINRAKVETEAFPLYVAPDPFKVLHEMLAVLVHQASIAGAAPLGEVARSNAKAVLEASEQAGFAPSRILAGPSGVFIYFSRGEKYAEVECDNDGDIGMVTSDRTGNPHLWISNHARLSDDLAGIRAFIV
jgi:hypothetical protein